MKTTSRFAIAAAAGMLLGGYALQAQAADLGGDCCADLEERVAELEATTARKGTRVVSLTISGQVNKAVLFWDDGYESNTYVVDHTASSTRWRFAGSAQIDPDWSAGYLLEWESPRSPSNDVDQFVPQTTPGLTSRVQLIYLHSNKLGRVSWGFVPTASGGIAEINLGNSIMQAGSTMQQSFMTRRTDGLGAVGFAGGYTGVTWGALMPAHHQAIAVGTRYDGIRYDSPSLHGFVLSSGWYKDDVWDVALRYAKEWNSIRLAAGIGYWTSSDSVGGCTAAPGIVSVGVAGRSPGSDCNYWAGSVSAMHVPSGIYVTFGAARWRDDNRGKAVVGGVIVADPVFGAAAQKHDKMHYLQVGIQRRWHALGNTTVYGEFYWSERGTTAFAPTAAGALAVGAGTVIHSTEVDFWGIGVTQNVSAAAMDLYLQYRNYSADVNLMTAAGARTAGSPPIADWHGVWAGGIIRF